jgi:hypothetical protein
MIRSLPPPVARFREIALDGAPIAVESVVIRTSASMRRPGMPTIPLRVSLFHLLGVAFIHDIRVGVGRWSLPIGLDAYVDGRGLMKVGRSVQTGTEFDQGALIALWGEALAFPWAWDLRDDVRWEPVGDDTARLLVPGPEGEIPISVAFEPASGYPAVCEADRYKSRGPKVRWRGTMSQWQRFEQGVLAPGRFEAEWADEPRPWIVLRTESVRVNEPVTDALDVGRKALGEAGQDPAVGLG